MELAFRDSNSEQKDISNIVLGSNPIFNTAGGVFDR